MASDAFRLGYVSHPIHPEDELALARDLPEGFVPRPRHNPNHSDYRRSGENAELVWPPVARIVSTEARDAVNLRLMQVQWRNETMRRPDVPAIDNTPIIEIDATPPVEQPRHMNETTRSPANPDTKATPTVDAGAASAIVLSRQMSDSDFERSMDILFNPTQPVENTTAVVEAVAQASPKAKPRRVSRKRLAQALSRRANNKTTTEDKKPMAASTPAVPRTINKDTGAIPKRFTNATDYFLEQKASSSATGAEPQGNPFLSTLLNLTTSVNGLQKTTKDAMAIRQTTLPNLDRTMRRLIKVVGALAN